MLDLTADQLRSLATMLDGLTANSSETGVRVAVDVPMYIDMPGWPHSLEVTRSADGDYRLSVGGGH